ncbi:hypothetical protein KC887_01350 [Candidatus Kaiserbacteria bacterium]|nr:hypothetical protein [Candidatus Kaiserbacteria bacterium]
MYKVTYKGLKVLPGHQIAKRVNGGEFVTPKRGARPADGQVFIDPMRYPVYAEKVIAKRKKRRQEHAARVEASRSYIMQPAKPQRKTRPSGSKRAMHSKSKFMQANIMAEPMDAPITGELIQPLRGREWQSEFLVPFVQAGVTGLIAAAGAGIVLAISHELLDTVRAGLVEFGAIGWAGWVLRTIQNTRRYEFVDAMVEALPFGVLVGGAAGVYYLIVTGHWFTFGWGAAISGITGFAALAYQWLRFLGKADDLLYAIERVINVDLDGDGYEGEPPVEPSGVREIPVNRGDQKTSVGVDNSLPVDSHVWQSFAVAVLVYKCNISKNAITKMTSESGWKYRKISQPAYGAIYRYCEKNRYIETDSVTGSNTLSEKGWAELSRWLPNGYRPNLPHPSQEVS